MKASPLIHFGIKLLIVLGVWAINAGVAYAGGPPACTDLNGDPAPCGVDGFCPADVYPEGIVERIVLCIQDHVLGVAYGFIYGIYPYFETSIAAFMTLSVIFFGVRMVMPMLEKPGRDSMIFLLKVAGVIYFTQNMDLILYWFVGEPGDWVLGGGGGILGQLIEVVTQFTIFDFDTPLGCPSGVNVWQRIDCMIDLMIGVNTPQSLSDGMLAFFFHNFFVGSVGVVIFLLGIWMMFSFMMMLLGAIHTYLMALMMICLLVIVGVLFCPLIMFKNTFDIFQKWVRMLTANLIIPMILFAYANVMLSAFDIVLYSGEYSVFRTFAGDAVDADGFSIQAYMYNNGLVEEVEDKGIIHDQRAATRFETPDGEEVDGEVAQIADVGEEGLLPNPGLISEIPIAIPMQKIDYNAAAGLVGAASGPALLEAVLAAMIITALVSYILIALMKFVPMLAEDLAGGVSEAPSIARVSMEEMPMVGKGGGATGVAEGFRSRMNGMLGRRR